MTTKPESSTPIPQPDESFLLGNLTEIDPHQTTASLMRLAALYGPIYQLKLRDYVVFVGSQKFAHAVSNEDKWEKFISAPLEEVRNFAKDGLFTAYPAEHNWTLAHRILIPAFGPLAIKKMQPMMLDIISQMLLFWDHHAGQPFDAADQYTRLTFDTIGWCAFKYRFNSYHTEAHHPFIDVMVRLLLESGDRARRPDVVQWLHGDKKYREDIKQLWSMADEIVAERRRNPDPEANDLLNNMILDKDPKTGERLSDENIRFQMVTFLIAGHETTSGMLSFATYYMLKNPDTFTKAREEADKEIKEAGGNMLKINPAKLRYIDAICKETLRLQPTAPAWSVTPKAEEGETLPGGYHVPKGRAAAVLLHALHRDPEVWGADAEAFRPERFLDGKQLPPDAYKPFGNGARACIGRGFAIQEAVLAIALIVSRFDLEMADPSYDLEIKQTLTIKPENFKIIARPRRKHQESLLSELMSGGSTLGQEKSEETVEAAAVSAGENAPKLYVLYGSNSGSCEGLAREIATEGSRRGFDMRVGDLDSTAGGGKLPTDAPVIIVTASYEGKPTDNARMFVAALQGLPSGAAKGVKYMVMGAGHHDWAQTFHKIPKYVDERLAELGGERIAPLSLGDAGGDLVGDFESFQTLVWEKFGQAGASAGARAASKDPVPPSASSAHPEITLLPQTANPAASRVSAGVDGIGEVLAQSVLVPYSETSPQQNHIRIKLPAGSQYRTGDYLAVLPNNPKVAVERVLKVYKLDKGENIVLDLPTSFLPSKTPLRVDDLLTSYVELGQPVPKRCLTQAAEMCTDEKDKKTLLAMVDDYAEKVIKPRLSLLDVIEQTESCNPPLAFFLTNLPKMKIRQYSISSTPLENPEEATLTFTVHTSPTNPGKALGVASNYLAFLEPGDKLLCAIKSSAEFHPPSDPTVPIVMFAAGTGMAPFRGFIHERALQKKAGRNVGPTLLFYGCRTEKDVLHTKELCQWVKDGVVDFRPVFSRSKCDSLDGFDQTAVHPDQKYVQHRVWAERDTIRDMFEKGAYFYTCGSGAKLAADLRKTLIDIIKDDTGRSEEESVEIMDTLSKDRYSTDVFL